MGNGEWGMGHREWGIGNWALQLPTANCQLTTDGKADRALDGTSAIVLLLIFPTPD